MFTYFKNQVYWTGQHHIGNIQTVYLNSKIQRIIDIFGAILGLVIGCPFLIIASLVIKIIDNVPVIFYQQRYGKYGKEFILYKLKTLTINETTEMVDAIRMEKKPILDPTVTRTGYFWRRTSIDEIPQFLNVLRGNMSLVGYRPFPYYYAPRLHELSGLTKKDVEYYLNCISSFKPGLTSLSSIHGRSKLKLQQKMEYDMLYAEKACVLHDIKIILDTMIVVVTQDGAW